MMPGSWIGQTIGGRYQIEALLGQGGMSAVYRATDPNLRRAVAVKLIHPHLSIDPSFIGRFKEEAAAVARLRHPNIVQVHDFNRDDDTYYMVMEYLAGETLQARLRRLNADQRYMPLADAVRICLQICAAAGYAHKHELVHRDIKPANIMLDVDDRAILMDFGIVKIVGGEYQTATGATIGTAMYMSPEQIRSERADERADIYSLGVTLYEMLSGRTPYQADSAVTLMMMVLNDPLPEIKDLRADVPESLIAVARKALAKEPTERYHTMEEMAADLGQAQNDLKSEPLAATIVDEDEPNGSDTHMPETVIDSGASSAVAQPLVDEGSLSPTVQDLPDVVEIDRPVSSRSGSRRGVMAALGVIILLAVVVAGFLYNNFRKTPEITLTPISQPQSAINAETAKYVVNLGTWELDARIESLAYSPDGDLLGTANNRERSLPTKYQYYAGLWQAGSSGLQHYFTGHSQWVYDVAFSPDGSLFGSASEDGRIRLWGAANGASAGEITGSPGGYSSLDFSPNGLLLAAGEWDGAVGLWQLSDGNLLRKFEGHSDSIRDVEFSPDGRLLASASDDNTMIIWGVDDGALVRTMTGHAARVNSLAFSQDGTLMASASEDQSVILWQVSDGKLLKTNQGHTDAVYDLAFSPDGSLLASVAADGTLRLWETDGGYIASVVSEHSDSLTSVVFSPDGHSLVTGGTDGLVQFWGISTAIPIESE